MPVYEAETYDCIHRSNLVSMGILPLRFRAGENVASLGLNGEEIYDLEGLPKLLDSGFASGREITVRARRADGGERVF